MRTREYSSCEIKLMDRFPLIYSIATNKAVNVREAAGFDGSFSWNVPVARNLNDWELEQYESILSTLASINLTNRDDKLLWNLKKNSLFSVDSLFCFFDGHHQHSSKNLSFQNHLEFWRYPKDFFLCMGGSKGEDPYLGELDEKRSHNCQQMFFV